MAPALHGCPEAIDFLQQCLRRKPEDRPTAAELLRHPWVTRASTSTLPMIYKSVSQERLKPGEWAYEEVSTDSTLISTASAAI